MTNFKIFDQLDGSFKRNISRNFQIRKHFLTSFGAIQITRETLKGAGSQVCQYMTNGEWRGSTIHEHGGEGA